MTEQTPPIPPTNYNKLKAVQKIVSSAGDFEVGDAIPSSVPMHARKHWVNNGLAE